MKQEPRQSPVADRSVSNLSTSQAFISLIQDGGLRSLKLWVLRLFRDGSYFHPGQAALALKAEILWSRGDHAGVRDIASRMLNGKQQSTLGLFYLAQSAYVRADFRGASDFLQQLICLKPDHSEGVYLLAACLRETGGITQAWSLLEGIAMSNSRVKTWQHLANLVETPEDLRRVLSCHAEARKNQVIPTYSREISNHLSIAAMRANDYELAKSIWRGILKDALESPARFTNRRPRVDIYSKDAAATALLDLKRALEYAGIEMFLISGTLLGCIREGRPLSHDKDIDVGIWDDVPEEKLASAIHRSGMFFFIHSHTPWLVRVRHLNGIPLDLFYHYREPNTYWHGATKLKWHNSPFTLKPTRFLNASFLIPADHDTYLRENYGDWVTPKTEFDSMFDTPNGEVIQKDGLIVHCLKQLFESISKGSPRKTEYYLAKLDLLGEHEFVSNFRKIHPPCA